MKSRRPKSLPGSGNASASIDYEPKPQECVAAQRIVERRDARASAPKFRVDYTGATAKLTADHAVEALGHILLADSLATGETSFSAGLLEQIANAARAGKQLTSSELNFMLAVVHEIGPRDPLEALLAVQMAAIHNATMVAARRLNHSETIAQQDSASNMLKKLARTFASQVEALKRHRSTGEQHIRVQHVTVNEGGQAIVGDVAPRGGGHLKKEHQPHGPSEAGPTGSSLLSDSKAFPPAMPSTGDEGLERVPLPRSAGRSSRR